MLNEAEKCSHMGSPHTLYGPAAKSLLLRKKGCLGKAEAERPTCLRRPNLFPCVGKDWGEKDANNSKTAITYLLKKGTVHTDRPFCLSDFHCRKSPRLFVMAVSALKNLQCAPAGAGWAGRVARPYRVHTKNRAANRNAVCGLVCGAVFYKI